MREWMVPPKAEGYSLHWNAVLKLSVQNHLDNSINLLFN